MRSGPLPVRAVLGDNLGLDSYFLRAPGFQVDVVATVTDASFNAGNPNNSQRKARIHEGTTLAPNPTGRVIRQAPLAPLHEETRVGRRLVRTRPRGKAEYVKIGGATRRHNLAKTVEYVLHVTPVSGRFRLNRFHTIEIDGPADQAGNPMSAPVFRTFRAVARQAAVPTAGSTRGSSRACR